MNSKNNLCIVTANYYSFMGFIKPWYNRLRKDFNVTLIGNFAEEKHSLKKFFRTLNLGL